MDEYYKKTINQPHSYLLPLALKHNKFPSGLAYDLGCGVGNDSRYLVQQGWKVIAVDATESLKEHYVLIKGNVEFNCCGFEQLQFKSCELIHARYALPFCRKDHFSLFWQQIRQALKPGGTFSGELFGKNDSWNSKRPLNFHTTQQLSQLFSGFDVCFFDDYQWDGESASTIEKRWHVYSFVLKKL